MNIFEFCGICFLGPQKVEAHTRFSSLVFASLIYLCRGEGGGGKESLINKPNTFFDSFFQGELKLESENARRVWFGLSGLVWSREERNLLD